MVTSISLETLIQYIIFLSSYIYTNLNGSWMIFALASVGNASVVHVADSELPSECNYCVW